LDLEDFNDGSVAFNFVYLDLFVCDGVGVMALRWGNGVISS
jgi:hypothetical protein